MNESGSSGVKPVLFVVGPTAVGKSELAMRLAKSHGGEIINADSVQVYRHVDIGTAKPTIQDRQQVVHHLVDFVEPPEQYTAGSFRRDTLALVAEQQRQRILSLITGGSGFYFKALEKGMFSVPAVPEAVSGELEARANRDGLHVLYERLKQIDVKAAARIHVNDRYRILRALEVFEAHGKSLSSFQAEFEAQQADQAAFPYSICKIGLKLDRSLLRQRVQLRTERMLQQGWVDEVRGLHAKGLGDWPPLQSVGYAEILQFLDGKISEGELLPQIVTSTMQLAKRQMTWFRADPQILWLDASQPMAALQAQTESWLVEKIGQPSA